MLNESCKLISKKDKTNSSSVKVENNFDSYFIEACTQFNIGNYSNSIRLFSKCADIKPEEASIYYQLSRCYNAEKNKNLALQNALKAYNLAPLNSIYVIWYCERLKDAGLHSQSLTILEKAFQNEPTNKQILKMLDNLYIQSPNNTLNKRIAIWEKYKSVSPYKLQTELQLIDLYKLNKDYASAHKIYDEIKRASPLKYQYYIDDANLYLEHKDEENARINFNKALSINPNNFQLNTALFKQEASKTNISSASNYLSQALKDQLTSVDKKLLLCSEINKNIFKDSSYKSYALLAADILKEQYPQNANAIYTAGKFYFYNSKYESALQCFKQVNIQNPNLYDAWLDAIRISDMLSLHSEKLQIAKNAIEFYPSQAFIYLKASEASLSLKDYVQSLSFSSDGLVFAFDDTTKYQLLKIQGLSYFKTGEYSKAEISLNAALAINKEDKELYNYLGDVYYKMNQKEKAIENWSKAKELGLKSDILERKLKEGTYVE